MASNQQAETCTVPVGTRLSYGTELELLVAYVYTADADPDELKSSTLAPLLRVDGIEPAMDPEDAVQEHIRTTLRDHGIRVQGAEAEPNNDEPNHLDGLDNWVVTVDNTAREGLDELEGTPGEYRWLGLELTSPACWDVSRAHDETVFVVNLIKSRYRVRVNPSCGFHVHVGNGPRYFDAKTLKRAGAFLWAADPMLSRLHAPWRRVGEYGTSIRYRSRLACWEGMQAADAQALVDRARVSESIPDPMIPVVPWSDTSLEEAELGGRVEWEKYARERLQNGPFITLDARPMLPDESEESSDQSTSDSFCYSTSPSSSSSFSKSHRGDAGGEHDRLLRKLFRGREFRDRCNEQFGHPYPMRLSLPEQHRLLSSVFSEQMYDASLDELSPSEQEEVIRACAPYLGVLRSSYKWNPDSNTFVLRDANLGLKLFTPQSHNYLTPYNPYHDADNKEPSAAVARLTELVELQEQGRDDSPLPVDEESDGGESITEDDLDNALYNRLGSLMQQPSFPLDLVDRLLEERVEARELSLKNRRRAEKYLNTLARSPFDADNEVVSSPLEADGHGSSGHSAFEASRQPSAFRISAGGFNTPASRALSEAPSGNDLSPCITTPDNSVECNSPAPVILFRPIPIRASDNPRSPGKSAGNSILGLRGGGRPDSQASSAYDLIEDEAFVRFPDPLSPAPYYGDYSPVNLRSRSNTPETGDDYDLISPYASDSSGKYSPWSGIDESTTEEFSRSSSFVGSTGSGNYNNPPSQRNNRLPASGKLQPHDITQLPISYVAHVSADAYLKDAHWDRIAWLPRPGGRGKVDPRQAHPRGSVTCGGPECRAHVTTTTRAGLATILGVDSAAALATLLISPGEDLQEDEYAPRLNYNFQAYAPFNLGSEIRDSERRTVEFREAAGSLDPEWIVTWSRICVGIMRFCRDASVSDFISVLEKVVRQEERVRDGKEMKYDVCDLLEDMGLFAEAAIVRRRERELGPPR
ncbi:hypothetical protein F5Y07DRAFT_397331 [Xylaria sp. FL0933]|nr:hypothetical protein F5Y07DRAFT_397331 [Xylaria sp. FL0933]